MEEKFFLSCESTVDLPYSYVGGRGIDILFYSYEVDGTPYTDDMGRDPNALPQFYQFIADGKIPKTSQINLFTYLEYFKNLLDKKEGSILHIAFGSGMTPSVNNARLAAEQLKEQYPDRKIVIIDSYCSSSGYGLLVDSAADLRDEGKSLDEIVSFVTEQAKNVHHQFFSTDLQYFKRSGRVSGPAAMLGTVFGICPIMRLNESGHIIAYDKVRGKKNAIKRTVSTMLEHAVGGAEYDGKCFISHSNSMGEAEELRDAIEAAFPKLKGKIRINDIGTIIAAHCGPGTVAAYFYGDQRAE